MELYDVATSGFGHEIPTTNDPVAEALRQEMDRYWKEYRDRRGEKPQTLSDEELQRLRSLGYVQ